MMKKRRSFLKLILLAGVGWFFTSRQQAKAYYSGNSINFNGKIFVDPDGSAPKSLWEVLKWQTEGRDKAKWEKSYPVTQSKPPSVSEKIRITFIGHASWLYQLDNLNILIDPVFSERTSPVTFAGPKRVTEVGVKLIDLPKIDYVLITHNHYDHMDMEFLKTIHMRDKPVFVMPLGNDTILKEEIADAMTIAMDWGDKIQLKTITLHCEPTKHWSSRGLFDRNKALWASFVLATSTQKILHIGDTGYGTGIHYKRLNEKHKGFDVAIIPIGAYEPRWFMKEQHVNPTESVQIFEDINATTALASHWGTFQLTDEAREAPVQDLAIALKVKNLTAQQFKVLQSGEAFEG